MEWRGHFGTFCRKDGETVVTNVEYAPLDGSEPIDLTDVLSSEIDIPGDIMEDARVDAEQAYGDYQYECEKDRRMGL